jgi:Glycosyl transferase family 2
MRVNLIGTATPLTGLAQDTSILHAMFAHVLGPDSQIRHVPHFQPHAPEAEINVFIEVMNPALLPFAAVNIWVPNPEWTYQTWFPYAAMVDQIWVKTHSAVKMFEAIPGCAPVHYVGWTSIDKKYNPEKNYSKGIVPVGKNVWRHPKPLVQAYMRIQHEDPPLYELLPELTIVHSPAHVRIGTLPEYVAGKIKLVSEVLSDKDYDALLAEAGLVVCLSVAEGFGHAVNEAMSSGCVPLISPIAPFMELTKSALWTSTTKEVPHPQCMGVLEDTDVSSVVEALHVYVGTSTADLKSMSDFSRKQYEDRHAEFVERMAKRIDTLKGTPHYAIQEHLPKEEDLPSVSIITLTRDRRAFIPLLKYCRVAQSYPESKVEWVIVDDGTDPIKDLITDMPNVKYILVDTPLTIGAKRNLAVEYATHDVLVMMDDDDVYPTNSVLKRVAHMLAEPRKECLFSTVLPCYEIHKHISFMNVPPATLPMSQRVSEATLCFTRDFWKAQQFPDIQVAEGDAFIRGREHMCRELSPQDVIVSLVHRKNTSARKPPVSETNGCHYGFSDELFTLVSEIAGAI